MKIYASVLVYLGLIIVLLACISLVKPLRFLGIHSRSRAAMLLGGALLLSGAGFAWPAKETRIAQPQTQLDQFAPAYQFGELHATRVAASCSRTYAAIKGVRADEIFLFRTLTWIRRFGRAGPESILKPSERSPLLEVATRTSFVLLAEEPGREVVVGTAVATPPGFKLGRPPVPEDFKDLHAPGFAIAAMNFLVSDAGPDACLVTTETRVFATDESTQRKFGYYWRVIYPGSALLRIMWLRAIKRRAETAAD
jgi:hypothetical protein